MGWRGYKGTIAAGMLFKKMYCRGCGNKLKIKKTQKLLVKLMKVILIECQEKETL